MQPVIVHIATRRGITAMRNTKRQGQSLGAQVVPVLYDEIPDRRSWPRGIYLFTDMQRATEWQREVGALLWERLAEDPEAFHVFNHPLHSLRRYQLLRALHEHGINGFNAYRLDELPGSVRYPVFVRYENQHIGPSTGLLQDDAELQRALADLLNAGPRPVDLIVVEFLDTTSTDWSVKREINDRALVGQEDLEFVKTNPHAEQVMEAFQIAGLTWGRIDYGVLDGRIQVWEINDNPKLGSSFFKKTMGRKLARRVSRAIRRSVWKDELRKVAVGAPGEFMIDAGEFAQRLREGKRERVSV